MYYYSSYEDQNIANASKNELGASHFLELNAFRSTQLRNHQQVLEFDLLLNIKAFYLFHFLLL